MLELVGLSKKFGEATAIDGLSLSVDRGQVVGLIGPNGAGKSAILRVCAGSLEPTAGSVRIDGYDIRTRPLAARRLTGYLAQTAPCDPAMTPAGLLRFVAAIHGLGDAAARPRIAELAERLMFAATLGRPLAALAPPVRRRIGLAAALLHEPPLLLLDEPTDGLDPCLRQAARDIIREAAAGAAIVLATNQMADVEALCSRAVVIVGGGVVADGAPAELAARSRYRNAVRLVVPAAADSAGIALALARLPAVRAVEPASDSEGAGWWLLPWRGRPMLGEIGEFVSQRGWPIDVLRAERGRLDDVFGDLTGAASPPVRRPA